MARSIGLAYTHQHRMQIHDPATLLRVARIHSRPDQDRPAQRTLTGSNREAGRGTRRGLAKPRHHARWLYSEFGSLQHSCRGVVWSEGEVGEGVALKGT